MRSIHWKSLLIGVLIAAIGPSASLRTGYDSAEAQPKKGKDKGKKEEPKKEEPKPEGADEGEIEMGGDEKPAPDQGAAGGAAGAEGGVQEGEIEMEGEGAEPSLEQDTAAASTEAEGPVKATQVTEAKLSWQDIVVVIRKPFLKVRRTELYPFVSTTVNDNIIRHYSVGGQFNYFLTDVLAVGVEGQYYQSEFREPFDLVARQARRLPTVNKYNWSGALDFHYVPVYGKFAVLDKHIITWEAYFTAGIGATESQVVERDKKFPGFKNILITPNLGGSMRFFLFKWLTINMGVRDYMFVDQFEPTERTAAENATAEEAKKHSDGSFINNVMFQIGVSFWFPTSFEYTTFR